MDEIVFDRITFLIAPSKKRALKLQCVERGVTMTDAMTEAVDRALGRGLEAQPSEVADLVTAARDALRMFGYLASQGVMVDIESNELLRAALAPFREVGE